MNDRLPSLLVPREHLSANLIDQIAQGEQLLQRPVTGANHLQGLRDDYANWDEYNSTLLKRSFSTSEIASEYQLTPFTVSTLPSLAEEFKEVRDEISGSLRRLRSISHRLDLFPEASVNEGSSGDHTANAFGEKVFIVHGHDIATRDHVARFVAKVTGQESVILGEQANEGLTVIEKFERNAAEIGFAIVLVTADDEGRRRGTDSMSLRARQNVIFELGYFIGTLGRQRVAALYEDNVELPSDVSGMLYLSLAQNWQMELAREMSSAGVDVDLNKFLLGG